MASFAETYGRYGQTVSSYLRHISLDVLSIVCQYGYEPRFLKEIARDILSASSIPVRVVVDKAFRIIVSTSDARVIVLASDGSFLFVLAHSPWTQSPICAVDDNLNLYVLSRYDSIRVFDAKGVYLYPLFYQDTWNTATHLVWHNNFLYFASKESLNHTSGGSVIRVSANPNVYDSKQTVVDNIYSDWLGIYKNRLLVCERNPYLLLYTYWLDGKCVHVPPMPRGTGVPSDPIRRMAIDSCGRIHVVGDGEVRVHDPESRALLTTWFDDGFCSRSIAIDSSGCIYAANARDAYIRVFSL